MIKNILLTATLSLFAAGPSLAQQPDPIKVEHGLVQGASEDGLTVYRGIRLPRRPLAISAGTLRSPPRNGPV